MKGIGCPRESGGRGVRTSANGVQEHGAVQEHGDLLGKPVVILRALSLWSPPHPWVLLWCLWPPALPKLTSRFSRSEVTSSRRAPAQALSSPIHPLWAQLSSPQRAHTWGCIWWTVDPRTRISVPESVSVSSQDGVGRAQACLACNPCSNPYSSNYIHMAPMWISLFCLRLVLTCSLITR